MSSTFSPDDPHPCIVGRNDNGTLEYDHDWKLISDSAGDPTVINGTYSWVYWQCRRCGEEKEATNADLYDDDY